MTGLLLASGGSDGGALAVLGVIVVGLYFIPTVIATLRRVPNAGSVFVINLFLGWSLIGWVIALAMAMRSAPQAMVVNVHGYQAPAPGSAPTLPAGWYPDPHGAGQRYWNGRGWTGHTS